MCGIGGILRFDQRPVGEERLRAMIDQVCHRGPDGQGLSTQGPCGLIHTRLAILDLLGGHQPMEVAQRDSFGPLTLVFNGEIYNHHQLRQQLVGLGHPFSSDHCDTEVLLHGYRQWGKELPKRLHGMFAFAIWDSQAQELLLVRDRAGKKPMWIQKNNQELVFGSMAATVVAGRSHGQMPSVNASAMHTFLRVGYTFEDSLIDGLTAIPAAHWLSINANGKMEQQRYWRPPPISRASTSMGAQSATTEVITEAVHKRLDSDVPLGCFLSGGIDSSIVAAIAQKQLTAMDKGPLQTFCARMPVTEYDESDVAKLVAGHIGSNHRELVINPNPGSDVVADLTRLMAVSGEPMADSSLLATFWISKAACEHVHVALSGDGGDELFGGYDRYRAMRILASQRWLLRHVPRGPLSTPNARTYRTRVRRLVDAAQYQSAASQYQQMVHLFTLDQIRDLGLGDAGSADIPDWPVEADAVEAAMRWDLLHYLPYDLLRKVDRASMAVALEVRCPLLDTQVCDLAGHLPHAVLMPGGRPKGLLRQIAGTMVPSSITKRPKRGFAVPIGQWFKDSLRDTLHDHLMDGDLEQMGFASGEVKRYFDEHAAQQVDHTHRLFALLELSLWAKWLKNPQPPIVG